MLDASRGPFEPFWGQVTLETVSPVASKVVPLKKPCSCLGCALPKCHERAYVGPSWDYVGAMLAHLGSMLGPCSPILGLCLVYVDPPEVILELCGFHEFIFIPKFCLKKLSPVACEALIPFLQHHFSEKAESCWGRAHPR